MKNISAVVFDLLMQFDADEVQRRLRALNIPTRPIAGKTKALYVVLPEQDIWTRLELMLD